MKMGKLNYLFAAGLLLLVLLVVVYSYNPETTGYATKTAEVEEFSGEDNSVVGVPEDENLEEDTESDVFEPELEKEEIFELPFEVESQENMGENEEYEMEDSPITLSHTITECGATITEEGIYGLGEDIICDNENGVVISSSNVVFDCENKNIRSTEISNNFGIRSDLQKNVTIKNCNIIGFGVGVFLNESSNSVIEENEIMNGWLGIALTGEGFLVKDNTIKNSGIEGILTNANNSKITRNIFVNNSFSSSETDIVIQAGENNEVSNNKIEGSRGYGIKVTRIVVPIGGGLVSYYPVNTSVINNTIIGKQKGVQLWRSIKTKVYWNNILEIDEMGIMLENSQESEIFENNISFSGGGIFLETESNNNNIYSNKIVQSNYGISINKNDIFFDPFGWGLVPIQPSQGNSFHNNTLNNNQFGILIESGFSDDQRYDYEPNLLNGNQICFNDVLDINNTRPNEIFSNNYCDIDYPEGIGDCTPCSEVNLIPPQNEDLFSNIGNFFKSIFSK